jgi:2-polyprenyl-3-methyl-5-hydroxy-6-metoxy-1,4-benzoquinol methylase
MSNSGDRIVSAIDAIEQEVRSKGNKSDMAYFDYHKKRFFRMAKTVVKEVPAGAQVLDIGSHYLHASMILSLLGYQVTAVEVDIFWQTPFVDERLKKYGIEKIVENNLEQFDSIESVEGSFQLVLFTEILEHITFNPIRFWKRVYHSLNSGGVIYLTTPNAFSLPGLLRSLKNLLTLKGIGISIDDVFSKVTYGHHWKEYSVSEIKRYFAFMSADFGISITMLSIGDSVDAGWKSKIWNFLNALGYLTKVFAPTVEAVVRVDKQSGFNIQSPDYH